MSEPPEKTKRAVQLITASYPHRPALDTALSRIILQKVSEGALPETLRLYRPADIVAFGPQDTVAQGYRQAVQVARNGGFEAIQRLAGGRAAVFHEGTIAFAWTIPEPDPRARVEARFDALSAILLTVLRRLGIDARIGEVAGEYCPGRHSINARGEKKLMGVGQRLVARAAHVGGVIVVRGDQRIRDILLPVYDALQIPWKPKTVGSIEDELGTIDYEEALQAIVSVFASVHDLHDGSLAGDIMRLAEATEQEYFAP